MTDQTSKSPGKWGPASPGDFYCVGAALFWLIAARLAHAAAPAPALMARLRAPSPEGVLPRPLPLDLVERCLAGWSRRVPWRSDCMIQALAAKMWLDRRGLPTEMRLGAAKAGDGGLDAHVWLLSEGRVVTGGRLDDGWTAFAPGAPGPATQEGDAEAPPSS